MYAAAEDDSRKICSVLQKKICDPASFIYSRAGIPFTDAAVVHNGDGRKQLSSIFVLPVLKRDGVFL